MEKCRFFEKNCIGWKRIKKLARPAYNFLEEATMANNGHFISYHGVYCFFEKKVVDSEVQGDHLDADSTGGCESEIDK